MAAIEDIIPPSEVGDPGEAWAGLLMERVRDWRQRQKQICDLHDTEHALLTVSGGTTVVEGRAGVVDNLADWNGSDVRSGRRLQYTSDSQTKLVFCSPDAKTGAAELLLQGVRAELLVTVCSSAPQWNSMVSPTDALVAKGIMRKTPLVGATRTVWVVPPEP